MASENDVSGVEDPIVPITSLRFDQRNPRIPTELFSTDEEVVRYLLDEYDVEELVQSILSSGWIDYEPLIVEISTNVVYEGNRRLAALRLIGDSDLRAAMNYRLPSVASAKPLPDGVRVRFVASRAEARRFIAFKHINGPLKWDAYAKAKYAADWLSEGEDVDVVSKMLGDNHNTIRRLVAGYRVLEQAQERGFNLNDRTKKRFRSRTFIRQFPDHRFELSWGSTMRTTKIKNPSQQKEASSLIGLCHGYMARRAKKSLL